MPIRSPRGRAAAYRAFWQWPLRSPARLALTTVVVLAVAVGVSLAIGATTGSAGSASGGLAPPPSTPRAASGAAPRTSRGGTTPSPTRTALPPVPDLTPTTLPPSRAPAAALETAARWSGAWLRPAEGTTAQQWIDGLRPTTTDEYLGVLSNVDPGNIPSTRVTGEPRAVRVASRSVHVEVPTDALTLLVLVVDTEAGWRVAGYDRA